MRQPAPRTRLLGHPLIVFAMSGVLLLTLYGCATNPDSWPLLVGALFAMSFVMNAHGQVTDYDNWMREWEGMADLPPRSSAPGRVRAIIALAICAGIFLHGTGGFTIDLSGLDATPIVGIGAVAAIVLLIMVAIRAGGRRIGRARVGGADAPASVCVSRPIVPVPSMHGAFAALPEHCLRVLGG